MDTSQHRIIAMPSHIGGEHAISGIKWIGSKHDNPSKRNMERASGVIILNASRNELSNCSYGSKFN